ncbi:MAG: alcohol dehydrogenase catalytic domain-containing protein [Alphaproteobacteria bacterium]|nr:alcohol dehydrogenase catalytic domain-containing protein [Alphaproteobacteria bacterium]MBL7097747.1 alcohol dehydrogenase catalytic domain-containing protein [Alphaproteobacteria bacterium]
MMAALVSQLGLPHKIAEVPVPQPGPGEVLVTIVATGVCRSDLHAAEGDWVDGRIVLDL